jgi:hypothetical protein
MTTGLTAIYIVLMAMGLLWVISKTVSYVRKQRQMESRWNNAMYDEGFKAYLEKLKQQAPDENETDSGDKPAPGGAAP